MRLSPEKLRSDNFHDSAPHCCDSSTDVLRNASKLPAAAAASAPAPFPHGFGSRCVCGTLLGRASIFSCIIPQERGIVNGYIDKRNLSGISGKLLNAARSFFPPNQPYDRQRRRQRGKEKDPRQQPCGRRGPPQQKEHGKAAQKPHGRRHQCNQRRPFHSVHPAASLK